MTEEIKVFCTFSPGRTEIVPLSHDIVHTLSVPWRYNGSLICTVEKIFRVGELKHSMVQTSNSSTVARYATVKVSISTISACINVVLIVERIISVEITEINNVLLQRIVQHSSVPMIA